MVSSEIERVKEVIEGSGLDDDEIAEMMPISKTTAWRWRNGKVKGFTKNNRKLISDYFHVNYNWLKKGTGLKEVEKAKVAEDSVKNYESRKSVKEVSGKEREILIGYLREQAESLSEGLRLLSDLERNHDDS